MKLNSIFALCLTLWVDLILLLIGAIILVEVGVGGGIVIFLIEFYILRIIHKKIYAFLTKGNNKNEKNEKSVKKNNI